MDYTFYPKAVQERAIELGISDRATIDRRFKCFMTAFYIVMLAALVLIIGAWNGVTGFGEAYLQALLFLEVMNIYDGVVIDKLWVGYSKFWVLPGLEDMPYVQTWRQVLKKAEHAGADMGRRSGARRQYCRPDFLRGKGLLE